MDVRTMTREQRFRYLPEVGRERLVISTGLSVTVAGHMIRLERDEYAREAVIVVEQLPTCNSFTSNDRSAIKVAAELLARRARRFLGGNWIVHEYRS